MSLLKHIPWLLVLLSLIIALLVTFLLRTRLLPFNLTIIEAEKNEYKSHVYHDFDRDGFSECLEIINIPGNRYFMYINSWNGGTIDQTNYWEPVDTQHLLFADITGDDFDEIFTFTEKRDSLFLYVHDLISKKVLINRQFLLLTEAHLSPTGSYVAFFPACVTDPGIYTHKTILFAIRSSSRLPRSVYAFDLETRRIIKEFVTHSALMQLDRYDLTGDGHDELIITGAAWGNIHTPGQYLDDSCWLFVLNQKLEPVFPPLSFSEYPAVLRAYPVEINTERFLLTVPDYQGEKNIINYLYLIDARGKVHLRTQSPFGKFVNERHIVNEHKNPAEIYGWQNDGRLIKLNQRLEIVARTETGFSKFRTLAIDDLDSDNNEELICGSLNFLSIFDNNLNLLSRFPTDGIIPNLAIRENGRGNPLEIGMHLNDSFYRLGYAKNPLYTYLPVFFIAISGTVFVVLIVAGKLIMLAGLYMQIFKHYFYDSADGILIMNHEGIIRYTNNQVHSMLHLPHAPVKGEQFETAFRQYPALIDLLYKSRQQNQAIRQNISLGDRENRVDTDVDVQPLNYLLKKNASYLVEFRTAQSTSQKDKIRIWSRAVQKMAHDIKTPLSTLMLNLKALQTRMEKITVSDEERREISEDMAMMHEELEHIQLMTKNFLKFSNLEKPHFQVYDIRRIINDAVDKYKIYFTPDITCQVTVDDDVKPVWADPMQIEMVLHILLENALAAIKRKGLISINTSLAQYLEHSFSEYIEIEVADNGPGITEAEKEKIFEPYYSTKQEGTGMGLAIARKIIEDHKGEIEIHSKPDFGAVFSFSIPAVTEEENNE